MDSGDDLMSFESRTGDQDKTYLYFLLLRQNREEIC